MKRLIVFFSLLFALAMPAFLVGQTSAVDVVGNACGGNSSSACTDAKKGQGSKTNPIISVIKVAIDVLSFIVGAAAVVGIVASGLRLILANGDSGSVASARSGLVLSLVGVVVVLLAQTIVAYVLDNVK